MTTTTTRLYQSLLILLSALLPALTPQSAPAAEPTAPARQWAVLIAVQQHDNPEYNTISFTTNDAAQLQKILKTRSGIPADHILLMSDGADETLRPTLANLRRSIPEFLSKVGKDDQVLVFFTGHGERFQGETYLVPKDFSLERATKTGLPGRELRKMLDDCPAKTKFLILDCCHAGGARGLGPKGLDGEAVAKSIVRDRMTGCLVMASCRADEKSREWPERRQGIFTYWLCRALEGGADGKGDGRITFDAVYAYTCERVTATAQQVFGVAQSPVRIVGAEVEGVPTMLVLRPEPPESLYRRLAEHLDLEIRRQKLAKVGVLEFSQPIGNTEGLAAANLPAYCAQQVRTALAQLAGNSYSVVDAQVMHAASKGMKVEDVGNPEKMRPVAQRVGGLDAAITGTLRRRGNKMHVQCDLVASESGNSLATPSGVLPLSEDLAGDNGASFDNRQRPAGGPYDAAVVSYVQSSQDHPLLKNDFPFRLELWSIAARPGEEITAATPRKRKEFVQLPGEAGQSDSKRTELLVGARKGELFEIRAWNKGKQPVAMALLVDGLNTLGQRQERLSHAGYWVLDPERSYAIEGWYPPIAAAAKAGEKLAVPMKRFLFADMVESVAGRQKFGDSIGLITAAFYAERGRGLYVDEGPEEQREVKIVDFHPGRLLGVVNIRYVEESQLEKLLNGTGGK